MLRAIKYQIENFYTVFPPSILRRGCKTGKISAWTKAISTTNIVNGCDWLQIWSQEIFWGVTCKDQSILFANKLMISHSKPKCDSYMNLFFSIVINLKSRLTAYLLILIARKSALEKTQLSDVLITDNLFW